MKHLLIVLIAFFVISPVAAQENFLWDLRDSTILSKTELYSRVKMFIAETWNSADDVIQNDDKDGGAVLVKGIARHSLYYQLNDHNWTFSYNVKFQFRDNQYRLVIENVRCTGARVAEYEWAHMPVMDSYNWEKREGLRITNVNAERYMKLMTPLKADLQGIADAYLAYLKAPKVEDAW